MKMRVLTYEGQRRVRLGRKAMACGRMQSVIETKLGAKSDRRKRSFSFSSLRPSKLQVAILVSLLMLGGVGTGGYMIYANRQAEQQRLVEKARLEREKIASEKAAQCRAKVASAKTDQIGKVTYDELYGSSC